ncbi:hypothetical protein QA612_08315 [Evansella sp. AB-P1]|uniref:hypothetical protein n=1 Tax=Evansella sp. AB-P1 TaxID=3037653 RepID=UPI00241E93D6|nr:hypothetical protein [Evansella sp. AB-P1]MDG5787497.1 hypothetical protein [Evansella sp. AB-P1]
MNKLVINIIKLIAIGQILFVLGLFSYYVYIGLQWGFEERLILLMVSDGIFILFIFSSISILLWKKWGWWLTVIIYCKLILAKIITVISEIAMVLLGVIIESIRINVILFDLFVILLYSVIVFIFLRPTIRQRFTIQMTGSRLSFFIIVSTLILYFVHFIILLLTMS